MTIYQIGAIPWDAKCYVVTTCSLLSVRHICCVVLSLLTHILICWITTAKIWFEIKVSGVNGANIITIVRYWFFYIANKSTNCFLRFVSESQKFIWKFSFLHLLKKRESFSCLLFKTAAFKIVQLLGIKMAKPCIATKKNSWKMLLTQLISNKGT